jgi:hypothetical protein
MSGNLDSEFRRSGATKLWFLIVLVLELDQVGVSSNAVARSVHVNFWTVRTLLGFEARIFEYEKFVRSELLIWGVSTRLTIFGARVSR